MLKYPTLFMAFFFSLYGLGECATSPAAGDLMKAVVATYNDMSSYQDRGSTVMKMMVRGQEVGEVTVQFTTRFVRHGGYLFSWRKMDDFDGEETVSNNSCFWSTDKKGWFKEQFYGGKPEITEMTLPEAASATTGVTNGVSLDIFRLLTDDVRGFRYDQLDNLQIVGEETVAGIVSYKVTGNYRDGPAVLLWIGKRDNLIRKGTFIDAGEVSTFIRSDIVIGGTIVKSQLTECDQRGR